MMEDCQQFLTCSHSHDEMTRFLASSAKKLALLSGTPSREGWTNGPLKVLNCEG
jgi:hypothetical protein